MDTTRTQLGQVLELTTAECWALARTQPVGRLAWAGPHGPTLVPVNFVVSAHQVHVRTAAYSALARECDDSVVAFEVDEIDADWRSGWSVLMRGHAHLLFGPHGTDEPDVWPAGVHGLRVRIDVEEISGRRVV